MKLVEFEILTKNFVATQLVRAKQALRGGEGSVVVGCVQIPNRTFFYYYSL